MKTIKLSLLIVIIVAAGLFAFAFPIGGSVKGTIIPINGGTKAWAISQTDTFQRNISNGSFEISSIKPGTYRVVIEAVSPFKSEVREGIKINDGEVTDVGEIRLQQ